MHQDQIPTVSDTDLSRYAALTAQVTELREQLARLGTERTEIEQRLLATAEASGEGAEGHGFRVRRTEGRTVVAWNARMLDLALPEELRKLVITYTPVADQKMLKALEETGKLPEAALEAKTVTPPKPRFIVEAIQ